MNMQKLLGNRVTRAAFWFLVIPIFIYMGGCGKKKEMKVESESYSRIAQKVLYHPNRSQDFLAALSDVDASFPVESELLVLKGLAHTYQGEVYETVANLMAQLQLELYLGSDNPEHGTKFPITRNYRDIETELMFWLAMDKYHTGSEKETIELLYRNSGNTDDLSDLKKSIVAKLKKSRTILPYQQQTYLALVDNDLMKKSKTALPELYDYLNAEKLFRGGSYAKTLEYLDEKTLYSKNLFPKHEYVSYYNSVVFKLGALCHYRLAIQAFEEALNSTFSSSDSTYFKLMAIIYSGGLYSVFQETAAIEKLWDGENHFLISNTSSITDLVSKGKEQYRVDWLMLVRAIEQVRGAFPDELRITDDSDYYSKLMAQYLMTSNREQIKREVVELLEEFESSPKKMDHYPTLVSEFVRVLNLSPLARKESELIQAVVQNLVFDLSRSEKSWQRNRPAYLLSLFGPFRWHGGRLPDCIGFLIELRKKDERLVALHEVVNLFAGPILKGKTNVDEG